MVPLRTAPCTLVGAWALLSVPQVHLSMHLLMLLTAPEQGCQLVPEQGRRFVPEQECQRLPRPMVLPWADLCMLDEAWASLWEQQVCLSMYWSPR